jgi:adenylyl cyclase-associated protein
MTTDPQTALYAKALDVSHAFMVMAAKCKKAPQASAVAKYSDAIKAPSKSLQTFRCAAEFDNHWKAVREAFGAASWVVMEAPTLPKDTTTAAKESANFWLNKVRMANKEHKPWCDAVVAGIDDLTAFIKANCNTGVSWKPSGGSIDEYDLGGATTTKEAPKPAASASASTATSADPPAAPGGSVKAALFAEIGKIDQSSGRTAGLRHVTKDMKSSGAPAKVSATKPASASKAVDAPQKPKSITKAGMRWCVEHCGAADGVVTLDEVGLREEVYIGGCVGATIVVPSKCKAIAVDKCSKTNIVFEGAVSSFELVNCKRMKVQCKGFVPTIGIDKTDGILVYVSYAGRETKIMSSKSSEMNVSFPASDAEDSDMVEQPIPEQFVATITPENKIVMAVSEIYSG